MSTVASASVDVMLYEQGKWVKLDGTPPGSPSTDSRAEVRLSLLAPLLYQITASGMNDGSILLTQNIFEKLVYKVDGTFHQWRNEQKQVIGLSFLNPNDGEEFGYAVKQAQNIVRSNARQGVPPPQAPYMNGNASNGVYQDPNMYYAQQHQQQQQSQHVRDADRDSIGSAGHSTIGYKHGKSSYSSLHSANGVNSSAASLSQQERRCSQSSSGSGGPSSSANIYATVQTPTVNGGSTQHEERQNGMHVNGFSNGNGNATVPKTSGPPPPPPPPPLPSGKLPPVGTNAPPPPPPPPPISSMKVSEPFHKTSTSTAPAKSEPAKESNHVSNGNVNFLGELAAKLAAKANASASKLDAISTSSSSGTSSMGDAPEPIPPPKMNASTPAVPNKLGKPVNGFVSLKASTQGLKDSKDSPKGIRKTKTGFGVSSDTPATLADLEQMKQEIVTEMQQEITKAKQDIIDVIQSLLKGK